MLADQLDYVIGVDPHRDTHALAIVDVRTGGIVLEASVAASSSGYARALELVELHAPGRRAVAIEGTGSFGAGLTRFLTSHDQRVLEVGRLRRERRSGGKRSQGLCAAPSAAGYRRSDCSYTLGVPVKFVSRTLIPASALLIAACGHQGITEGVVRAQVRHFMSSPGGYLKVMSVPSCAKSDRKDEWQCRVRVFMPTTGKRFDLTVIASCAARKCELAHNDWTGYGPSDAPWMAVITDFYDGGIDHRHSCSAVRAAVDHLPDDASEVGAGIRAYERKVC